MIRLTILFCFLISFKANAQKGDVLMVNKMPFESGLEGYLYKAENLKVSNSNDIIKLKNQFKKVDKGVVNSMKSEGEIWHYFQVKNLSLANHKFVLLLDQTFLDKADLLLFEGDSLVSQILLNNQIKANDRPYASNIFAYPLNLLKGKEYCVFLRLKANPQNGVIKSLFTFSDEPTYFKNTQRNHLLFGLLMGVLLLAILTGIVLYVNSPRPIYLVYAAYIMIVVTSYVSNYSYLNGFFGHHHIGTGKFYHFTMMMAAFLQIHFVRLFLDFPQKKHLRLNKFIIVLSFYFLLVGILTLILPNYSVLPIISRSSISLAILLLLAIAFWAYFQKGKGEAAKFYLFALLPGLVMIFYLLCTSLDIFPIYSQIYSVLFPISAYEIVVFGAGLVYVYTKEKDKIERELATERAIIAGKIIEAQEYERERIAQDLHDDLGSTLSMLKYKLAETNEVLDNQLVNEMFIANKALDDLRLISHNLTPTLFLQKGLVGALREFLVLNKTSDMVVFIYSGNERRFKWEAELSILRVAKELLNNAIKHAKASKIELQVIYFEQFLYLSVEDNGTGILKNEEKSKGIGLKNINLRVNYLKGKINQESSERGTLISIEIPYEPDPKN